MEISGWATDRLCLASCSVFSHTLVSLHCGQVFSSLHMLLHLPISQVSFAYWSMLLCSHYNVSWVSFTFLYCLFDGDRLSRKHGNVWEFESCQGNTRELTRNL